MLILPTNRFVFLDNRLNLSILFEIDGSVFGESEQK